MKKPCYVLYSPPHDMKREAFKRSNTGKVVPEKVFKVGPRALYCLKGHPGRRYRSSYPVPDDKRMYLAKFPTIQEAIAERTLLNDYCEENFEIREWDNGKLGGVVED